MFFRTKKWNIFQEKDFLCANAVAKDRDYDQCTFLLEIFKLSAIYKFNMWTTMKERDVHRVSLLIVPLDNVHAFESSYV